MLSATPTLSIPSGQFFGAGFTPIAVTFQVNFTDTLQSAGEILDYDYSIDWGDGLQAPATFDGMPSDPQDPSELEFRIETPFGQNEGAGDLIRGRINERPLYTSPGIYMVTVTVNDAVMTVPVTVYGIDFGLSIGDPLGSEFLATEGSPFTLTLPTELPDETPIDSWIINWGDAIATDGGGMSAVHTYMDDADIQLAGPAYNITAVAVTNAGNFYAGGTNFMSVEDVPAVTMISGAASVDTGDLYTLNLSNVDPGNDPIVGWWVYWEGLADPQNPTPSELAAIQVVVGNPTSVTHTFPTGGTRGVVARAFTDEDVDTTSNTLSLTVNAVQQDGVFLVNGELSVIDTNPANDIVTISQSNGSISVTSNGGTPVIVNASEVTEGINVTLGSGHDIVVVSSNITVPLTIDGGAGNDFLSAGGGPATLIGGTGNDILWGGPSSDKLFGGDDDDDLIGGGGNDSLVGGDGNDIVSGGTGRDVAIGGLNEDLLMGGGDDDVLIGGTTIFDDVDGLDEIMAIWGSADSFASRVAQLTGTGGLLAATGAVTDDDAMDIIIGGAGRDLVFGDTNPADGVFDILALSPIQDVLMAVS